MPRRTSEFNQGVRLVVEKLRKYLPADQIILPGASASLMARAIYREAQRLEIKLPPIRRLASRIDPFHYIRQTGIQGNVQVSERTIFIDDYIDNGVKALTVKTWSHFPFLVVTSSHPLDSYDKDIQSAINYLAFPNSPDLVRIRELRQTPKDARLRTPPRQMRVRKRK